MMQRLHRVALAVRGLCIFVEIPRRHDGCVAERLIRRVGGLGKHVDLDRFPWVAVTSAVLAMPVHAATSPEYIHLDHNVDSRSFCYPALIAALRQEFGSDLRWSGNKVRAITIRLRGPGWDPAHPESGL